jgi:hypothetical protein
MGMGMRMKWMEMVLILWKIATAPDDDILDFLMKNRDLDN